MVNEIYFFSGANGLYFQLQKLRNQLKLLFSFPQIASSKVYWCFWMNLCNQLSVTSQMKNGISAVKRQQDPSLAGNCYLTLTTGLLGSLWSIFKNAFIEMVLIQISLKNLLCLPFPSVAFPQSGFNSSLNVSNLFHGQQKGGCTLFAHILCLQVIAIQLLALDFLDHHILFSNIPCCIGFHQNFIEVLDLLPFHPVAFLLSVLRVC